MASVRRHELIHRLLAGRCEICAAQENLEVVPYRPSDRERWVGVSWLSADDIPGRSLRFIWGREIVLDLRGENYR